MKLKEVCDRTGLTKRTVRFYEEKELLVPQKTYKNGREYREYSEEDIARLEDIATLRRARFTIQEIKRMDSQPEEIPDVFVTYREGLYQQQRELASLIRAAEAVKPEELTSTRQLIEMMGKATEELPLPAIDIKPHFRYLDDLEETINRRRKKPQITDQEYRQHQIAADNALVYAAFGAQNKPSNDMMAGGKGIGDISNAQKIAAYNLLMNSRDD